MSKAAFRVFGFLLLGSAELLLSPSGQGVAACEMEDFTAGWACLGAARGGQTLGGLGAEETWGLLGSKGACGFVAQVLARRS